MRNCTSLLVVLLIAHGCSNCGDEPNSDPNNGRSNTAPNSIDMPTWSFVEEVTTPGGLLRWRSPTPGGFAALAHQHIALFDTSDPLQPVLSAYRYRNPDVLSRAMAGTDAHLYVLTEDTIETYSADSLEPVGTLTIATRGYDALAAPGRLVVSGLRDAELFSLDDPTAPQILAQLDFRVRAMTAVDDSLYLLRDDGIAIVDTQGVVVAEVGIADLESGDRAIVADETNLYVTRGRTLLIYTLDAMDEPPVQAEVAGSADELYLVGSTLWLHRRDFRRVTAYDVADAQDIIELTEGELGTDRLRDAILIGDRLYAHDQVYDLSDTTGVPPIGSMGTYYMGTDFSGVSNATRVVALTGNALCVADVFRNQISVFDLREGLDRHHVIDLPYLLAGQGVIAMDGHCYASSRGRVAIIDVRDASNPAVLEATIESNSIYNLGVYDRYLLIATGDGVTVWDVSDPPNPVENARWDVDQDREEGSPFIFWAAATDGFVYAGAREAFDERPGGITALTWDADAGQLTGGPFLTAADDLEGVYGDRLVTSTGAYDISDREAPVPDERIDRAHCVSPTGEIFVYTDDAVRRFDETSAEWEVVSTSTLPGGRVGWQVCTNDTWLGVTRSGVIAVPLSR